MIIRDRGQPPKRHPEERQLEAALAELDLPQPDRANLCRRYLDYMDWLERGATRCRRWYYTMRVTAVVLAAIVPTIIAAGSGDTGRTVAAILGVVVAAATAAEAFLRLGERWRHYRVIVEELKIEMWLFIQHAGRYKGTTHAQQLPAFVERMEALVQEEVRQYVSTVVSERASSGDPSKARTGLGDDVDNGAGRELVTPQHADAGS